MRNVKIGLSTIFRYLPGHIRAPLERAAPFYRADVQEIILRAVRPLVIECADNRYYLTQSGALTASHGSENLLIVSRTDMDSVFKHICDYSVYAHQTEINNGYIMIQNGVRVGVCGTAVHNNGEIINIKDISTMSFRAAGEFIGCSEPLLSVLDFTDGVLICGPPRCGKTTLIRDIARVISQYQRVSIIDERNEITATCGGVSAYDIGSSDVFVGMKKGVGIVTALRSMSPDIIICDELGDSRDADDLRYALRCGVAFVATVHARELEDLRRRDITAELLSTGAFRYVVLLGDRRRAGQVRKIYELRDMT